MCDRASKMVIRAFMTATRGRWVALIVGLCLMTSAGKHPSAQSGYTLIDIISGPFGAFALDINDNGVVVGGVGLGTGFIWTQAVGAQPIPVTSGQGFGAFSSDLRINNDGVVAGFGCGGGSVCQAEIWRADIGEIALGCFGVCSPVGNPTSTATALNDQGQVAGWAWGGGYNNFGPFTWSSATGLQQLGGFSNVYGAGLAHDINRTGQIVGASGPLDTWIWSATAGLIATIPPLSNFTAFEGLRINDSGVVVGRTFLAPDNRGGMFRWSSQTGTEDLNALGAPYGSVTAIDMNNAGDIVATIDSVPYLYSDGTWTNINNLMPPGSGPYNLVTAINNRGWIVGHSFFTGHGFLLIPPNRAPTAVDGTLSGQEDIAANGTLSATDPDGDAVTYSIVANGTKGTATMTNPSTGAFTYTPNLNANGTDTFTFKVNDGVLDSNVATETITIAPINDAPVAANGTASVNAGSAVSGTLVATDVDSANLTYVVVTNGAKGTATITNTGTGAYSYAANAGSSGADTFTFKANDGVLDSNLGTITVTIASSCATNISSSVALSQGPIKADKKTGRFMQVVTLKNSDGAVAGPVSLVLDSLSPNASLVGASGTTACAAPAGSAYVNVSVGVDGVFGPRERATVTLEFVNPSGQPIVYTPRVLVGGGAR